MGARAMRLRRAATNCLRRVDQPAAHTNCLQGSLRRFVGRHRQKNFACAHGDQGFFFYMYMNRVGALRRPTARFIGGAPQRVAPPVRGSVGAARLRSPPSSYEYRAALQRPRASQRRRRARELVAMEVAPNACRGMRPRGRTSRTAPYTIGGLDGRIFAAAGLRGPRGSSWRCLRIKGGRDLEPRAVVTTLRLATSAAQPRARAWFRGGALASFCRARDVQRSAPAGRRGIRSRALADVAAGNVWRHSVHHRCGRSGRRSPSGVTPRSWKWIARDHPENADRRSTSGVTTRCRPHLRIDSMVTFCTAPSRRSSPLSTSDSRVAPPRRPRGFLSRSICLHTLATRRAFTAEPNTSERWPRRRGARSRNRGALGTTPARLPESSTTSTSPRPPLRSRHLSALRARPAHLASKSQVKALVLRARQADAPRRALPMARKFCRDPVRL